MSTRLSPGTHVSPGVPSTRTATLAIPGAGRAGSARWGQGLALCATLLAALSLGACGGGASSSAAPPELSALAGLGEKIFRDTSLSASGRMACATCHDPAIAYASPFEGPVALGGPGLDQPGLRLPPTLAYLRYNTTFDVAADGAARGGFFWDGRAATLAEQARAPLLAASEMANGDAVGFARRLAQTPYAAEFRQVFGADIFASADQVLDRAVLAVQRYQTEDGDFAPFSSRFDQFVAGRATLNAAELRGLALFNRSDKGNCAACHPSTAPTNAPGALFTDFSYDNLGVPRNPAIPANADPAFFDLGLCGPGRNDLAGSTASCGKFRVPTLRNAATRKRFFHNGVFDSLEQVVRFYATRDTAPALWYPTDAQGQVQRFNDTPAALRANVNRTEVPFDRQPGQDPRLNDAEIQDLIAFLKTLTDQTAP